MNSRRRARILCTLGKERFHSPSCLPEGRCHCSEVDIRSSGSVDLEMMRRRKIVRQGEPSHHGKAILSRAVDDPALSDEILEATATELGRR